MASPRHLQGQGLTWTQREVVAAVGRSRVKDSSRRKGVEQSGGAVLIEAVADPALDVRDHLHGPRSIVEAHLTSGSQRDLDKVGKRLTRVKVDVGDDRTSEAGRPDTRGSSRRSRWSP